MSRRTRRRRQVHLIYRGRANRSFTRILFLDPMGRGARASAAVVDKLPSRLRRRFRRSIARHYQTTPFLHCIGGMTEADIPSFGMQS